MTQDLIHDVERIIVVEGDVDLTVAKADQLALS